MARIPLTQLSSATSVASGNKMYITQSGTSKQVDIDVLRAGMFPEDENVIYCSKQGSDSNSGLSWGKAKLTVNGAYNALPEGDTADSGSNARRGLIVMGAGTFTVTSPLYHRGNLGVVGIGNMATSTTDFAVTRLKADAALDDHMFKRINLASDLYDHRFQLRDLMLDGNITNQTNGGTFRYLCPAGETLTFAASGKTITGSDTSWHTGMTDGMVFSVTDTQSNNTDTDDNSNGHTYYTVSGTPSGGVVTVVETLTDETASFARVVSGPYDIVHLMAPGFETYIERVAFRSVARFAVYQQENSVNQYINNCSGSNIFGGFAHLRYGSAAGSFNVFSARDIQLDDCGLTPFHIEIQ